VDQDSLQVSHVDLYHKLGRLEALMETMMSSVSTFQGAIKDLHNRIDNLETRQVALEKGRSSDRGASSALVTLAKDFAIPVLALVIAWMSIRQNSVTEISFPPPASQQRTVASPRQP
jgi:hypothetical protein